MSEKLTEEELTRLEQIARVATSALGGVGITATAMNMLLAEVREARAEKARRGTVELNIPEALTERTLADLAYAKEGLADSRLGLGALVRLGHDLESLMADRAALLRRIVNLRLRSTAQREADIARAKREVLAEIRRETAALAGHSMVARGYEYNQALTLIERKYSTPAAAKGE